MELWSPRLSVQIPLSFTLSRPFLLPNKHPPRFRFIGQSNPFAFSPAEKRRRCCLMATAAHERKLEASWIEGSSNDGFGGWSVMVTRPEAEYRSMAAVPRFFIVGAGATVAVLLAVFAWFSLSRKGFKLRSDAWLHTSYELLLPTERSKESVKDTETPALAVQFLNVKQDEKADMVSNVPLLEEDNLVPVFGGEKHFIVPVAADFTQQEALSLLKKLKIIDNDTTGGELCTRREYARWLVKANSVLERNPKYRIFPLIPYDSSATKTFDDVSINDPDLWCIQGKMYYKICATCFLFYMKENFMYLVSHIFAMKALGEAGIVLSKLSAVSSTDGEEKVNFSPDSFISRLDLVNWKALLEYPYVCEVDDKMLRKKEGLLDFDAIGPYASPQLLTDLMAGDRSITRRVFGNIRRLQPHQPVTKAQAAVTLTSGRMAEAIHTELSRLEAEKLTRLAEMEEIRSELISRGEIQRLWEEKLNKEKDHVFQAERGLHVALDDLEKEKRSRGESFDVYTKDKAALDCQQKLLLRLREEVGGMCDRLATERTNLMCEQQGLEKFSVDLREKQDAISEAKSILEAEKEALQILRSWLEEEARRIQVRAKFLEQAAQRWKWNGESMADQLCSPGTNESQIHEETSESRHS